MDEIINYFKIQNLIKRRKESKISKRKMAEFDIILFRIPSNVFYISHIIRNFNNQDHFDNFDFKEENFGTASIFSRFDFFFKII